MGLIILVGILLTGTLLNLLFNRDWRGLILFIIAIVLVLFAG